MRPTILGIDPGTTTGYAVLDVTGNLLKKGSAKNISMGSLISKVIRSGNPIIIGCDKKTTPWFVEKMAAQLGAKVIYPAKDLLKEEKKGLVNIKTENDHETDALASAFFAYEQVKGLFSKIDYVLEKKDKTALSDNLKAFMIKHEKINIEEAIRFLERKPQPVKFKIPKQRIETTPIKELERLKQRILILEEKNKDLQGQLGEARKKAMVLERTTNNAPKDPVIRQKDRQIVLLSQRLREMKLQISELNNRLHLTVDFVADLNDKVLIKKLRNLTMNEFEDKQFLKIREGDILLVKDPNIVSHKLLEILQDKVKIIITREKVTVKKGFVYLNASNLKLKQIEDYAIVGKQDLERELARANVLDNVLQSYREERFRE